MARGILYLVFILPISFSIVFGSLVMIDILNDPDRELNMWRFDLTNIMKSQDYPIKILGLAQYYSTSNPIQIQVQINDFTLNCGDLYITISSLDSKDVISQSGFFEQCFGENVKLLPLDENFSEFVDIPGKYEIVIEMSKQNQEYALFTSEEFTVK